MQLRIFSRDKYETKHITTRRCILINTLKKLYQATKRPTNNYDGGHTYLVINFDELLDQFYYTQYYQGKLQMYVRFDSRTLWL